MGAAVVLVEVARVEKLLRRHRGRFLDRIFSPEEQAACVGRRNEAERLAARLAAKLATRRVLGQRALPLRAVSVTESPPGKASRAPSLAPSLIIVPPPPGSTFVSLAHDGGMAAAAVVFEGTRV